MDEHSRVIGMLDKVSSKSVISLMTRSTLMIHILYRELNSLLYIDEFLNVLLGVADCMSKSQSFQLLNVCESGTIR